MNGDSLIIFKLLRYLKIIVKMSLLCFQLLWRGGRHFDWQFCSMVQNVLVERPGVIHSDMSSGKVNGLMTDDGTGQVLNVCKTWSYHEV